MSVAFALGLSAFALDLNTPRGVRHLREINGPGGNQVSLKELATAFHGKSGVDPVSKYPFVIINGKRVVFSTTSGLASINGGLVRFPGKPVESGGDLLLPVSSLEPVLSRVLGGIVTLQTPTSKKRPPVAKPHLKSGALTMDVAAGYDNVRLTFTGYGARNSRVKINGASASIHFAGVGLESPSRNLGKGIVRSILVRKDGSEVDVILGKNFKSMSKFILLKPERLVVIFKGSAQQVGTPVHSAPPEKAPNPHAFAAYESIEPPPEKTQALDVVVIDPGHGGLDTGALSSGSLMEKTLTLAIAKDLKKDLEEQGIKAILTRTDDTTVPLAQRTAIANYNQADLFISIHINAAPQKSAKGAEVYFMSSKATDQWSKKLALKENSSGKPGHSEGGVNLVLWNLAQTAHLVESSVFAGMVQEKLNGLLGTERRGVRQAPFVVLEGAEMPAILVEAAFMTNPEEAAKLGDPDFLSKVAEAITEAVLAYKVRYERADVSTR